MKLSVNVLIFAFLISRIFAASADSLRVANSWSNQAAKPSECNLCRLSAQNLLNLQIFVHY